MNEPQQVITPKARETERGCAFIWENDVRLEFYGEGQVLLVLVGKDHGQKRCN